MRKCDVNCWDGYGLMVLHNWLRTINSDTPIYNVYNQDGTLHCQTPDARYFDDYKNNGYRIEIADKEKLRRETEESIARVQDKVNKWQVKKCACEDRDCERCIRMHCKNEKCSIHTFEKKMKVRF